MGLLEADAQKLKIFLKNALKHVENSEKGYEIDICRIESKRIITDEAIHQEIVGKN